MQRTISTTQSLKTKQDQKAELEAGQVAGMIVLAAACDFLSLWEATFNQVNKIQTNKREL